LLDFGVLGSLLLSLTFGIILYLVGKIKKGKRMSNIKLNILAFYMSTLIISFLISPFIAKYLVFNVVLIFLIILFTGRYNEE
jgi:predicted Co/Zn/Cd cation transporter (cation efflux family)